MIRRGWFIAIVVVIAACGQSLPARTPTSTAVPRPAETQQPEPAEHPRIVTRGAEGFSHGGPLRDHVSFVDHLRAREYEVVPVTDVRQPFLRAEGTVLRVSGRGLKYPAELQVYNYDDTDLGTDGLRAAEEDAKNIGPDGQPNTTSILGTGEPHFFRKERLLVLYIGPDKAVLDLLTELLGPRFAGTDTGETGCAASPPEPADQPSLIASPIAQWEFWPATLAEAEERATAVVLVRVTGVERAPEDARQTSFGSRRVTLQVVRLLQGVPDRNIRLFWGWTEGQYDENDPPYRQCEDYVLFVQPKLDETGTYLVVSPLGRYGVDEGKLRPVVKESDVVPSWVRELRGKSVGYLETQLAKTREDSPPATADDLTDFGTSEVQLDGQVNEPERSTRFVHAYRSGKPARWSVLSYTQEGDPISLDLRYAGKGKEVLLIADSTQDRHGSDRVIEYTCFQIVQKGDLLRLLRCTGAVETSDFDIPWKHR